MRLGKFLILISLIALPFNLSAEVKELQPQQLKKFMKSHPGTQLVDVREGWERRKSKIPQSKHIPLDEINSALGRLDPNKPVITYCQSGRRSRLAAETLDKLGFKEVYQLDGGIRAYQQEVK